MYTASFLIILNQFNLEPWPLFSFLYFPCSSSRTLPRFFHRSKVLGRLPQELAISNHSPLVTNELPMASLCTPLWFRGSGITYPTGICNECAYHAFLKPSSLLGHCQGAGLGFWSFITHTYSNLLFCFQFYSSLNYLDEGTMKP